MGALADLRRRRDARRWQRWTEVDPEDDLERRSGIGAAIALVFFSLVIAVVVIGLVIAR
ncbi:MAG: hypothetical protein JF623_06655 [Acidobacteria bacterium]|jgi:hypothetical protein|nr:hypothetical protein [Acidobacteriota bacterium]